MSSEPVEEEASGEDGPLVRIRSELVRLRLRQDKLRRRTEGLPLLWRAALSVGMIVSALGAGGSIVAGSVLVARYLAESPTPKVENLVILILIALGGAAYSFAMFVVFSIVKSRFPRSRDGK